MMWKELRKSLLKFHKLMLLFLMIGNDQIMTTHLHHLLLNNLTQADHNSNINGTIQNLIQISIIFQTSNKGSKDNSSQDNKEDSMQHIKILICLKCLRYFKLKICLTHSLIITLTQNLVHSHSKWLNRYSGMFSVRMQIYLNQYKVLAHQI